MVVSLTSHPSDIGTFSDTYLSTLALHFKLVVDHPNLAQAPEDTQFSYRPQLEHGRDDGVISILPDYLAEEISFLRSHVPRFYARVVKALTETTTLAV
jgi:hypothetical protein